MKPYDQHIVTFEAMFVGYTEALNRLEAASEGRSPAATYVPLFEALNWAYALDERVAAHWVPTGRRLDSVGAIASAMPKSWPVFDSPGTACTTIGRRPWCYATVVSRFR